MLRARQTLDEIIYGEIAKRRRHPDPERQDVLSLLLEARDEDGGILSDREVRDQTMTLLFAGHDTTTSTLSFLFYELARHPAALRKLLDEQDEVLQGRPPTVAELTGGLPQLEMALDETLRLYPAAWVGPRKALESFEFGGCTVPAGSYVNYSSWASHRLPDVWPSRRRSCPSGSRRRRRRSCPRAPTSPSAAARGSASGCASASSRSRRSRRCCCSASGWSCSPAAR